MSNISIHNENGFFQMRQAGELAAEVLDYITDFVEPNVSTEQLDQICHDYIIKKNAIPAPLNYKGYPKSTCISVNHIVCHGIPGEKLLQNTYSAPLGLRFRGT